MCYSLDDTIVAVATPPGVGALGIVRLSGNEAFKIASKVLQKPSGGFYSVGSLPSHTVHYAFLVDPVGGERIDEVLFALFKAPKSYTSQDMVEVTCHGGPVVLERALEAFVVAGARLARPGEFTLRAFLLGRLDLAQAEAVADLIESASEEGRRAAL
ncbi:MAG TPA: tRNA uridine-5-carboxymethylaminomethyl(34) synthesis GTPase MnmE, partial [Thermosulfidibacter takaii]|nr:tRNA uridine-5-carboxymethylaminomethyl(34) synthesis GTPase MnmE [Thermosulfidibacter takaii]